MSRRRQRPRRPLRRRRRRGVGRRPRRRRRQAARRRRRRGASARGAGDAPGPAPQVDGLYGYDIRDARDAAAGPWLAVLAGGYTDPALAEAYVRQIESQGCRPLVAALTRPDGPPVALALVAAACRRDRRHCCCGHLGIWALVVPSSERGKQHGRRGAGVPRARVDATSRDEPASKTRNSRSPGASRPRSASTRPATARPASSSSSPTPRSTSASSRRSSASRRAARAATATCRPCRASGSARRPRRGACPSLAASSLGSPRYPSTPP